MTKFNAGKTSVAVITGSHPYDVPGFNQLFRRMPDVDYYMQTLEDFINDWGKVRTQYDVVLFYNMHTFSPDSGKGWSGTALAQAMEAMLNTGQGIVVLHHALLAFPQWDVWSSICGIEDRKFGYHPDQSLQIEIANETHPITQGLTTWELTDESYTMNPASSDSDVLLTTTNPNSLSTVAWTRTLKASRVFCCALGHDESAWLDLTFQQVLTRAIQWCAKQ